MRAFRYFCFGFRERVSKLIKYSDSARTLTGLGQSGAKITFVESFQVLYQIQTICYSFWSRYTLFFSRKENFAGRKTFNAL